MQKTSKQNSQLRCFGIFLCFAWPIAIALRFSTPSPWLFFVLNFLEGILAWTYLEYHLHRFWTHYHGASASTVTIVRRHYHHHRHPTDIKVSMAQRMILAVICLVLLVISIRLQSYFTLVTGFVCSLSYSFFSHWLLHQPWSKRLCPRLHDFHIHHHCKYPNRCFGFSTIFWDVVFRTTPPATADIRPAVINFYYGKNGQSPRIR